MTGPSDTDEIPVEVNDEDAIASMADEADGLIAHGGDEFGEGLPEDAEGIEGAEESEDEDLFGNVSVLHVSRKDRAGENEAGQLRMIEALLFAAAEPLDAKSLAERLPDGADIAGLLDRLRAIYEPRGVNLVNVAGKWCFRTAPDLAFLLERERVELKKLSRAATEALAIIAYHQPVTRAEIEEIRGVALSRGTLDVLFEAGWVRPRGRRRSPGKPMLWGITEAFLDHFGLVSLEDLPGVEDLKAAGLLESRPGLSSYANRAGEETDLIDTDEVDPLDEEDLERRAIESLQIANPESEEDRIGDGR